MQELRIGGDELASGEAAGRGEEGERGDGRLDGSDPGADVVASTLEALQARVERAHREALRGAIDAHLPAAAGPRPDDLAPR